MGRPPGNPKPDSSKSQRSTPTFRLSSVPAHPDAAVLLLRSSLDAHYPQHERRRENMPEVLPELWQLKGRATISTTRMAEKSSMDSRGQRNAGSKQGRGVLSFSPEQTKVGTRFSQPNGLAMSTVCEVLQRARLNQGIDLATVAAHTKINAKYLQAIEADDRESLPGGFFYKSFVHQYAKFLGVNTSPFDAEIDRVLSADSPLPLSSAARQATMTLLPRSWSSRKYLSYPALVLILVGCYEIDGWWHKGRDAPRRKLRAALRLRKTPRRVERQAPPAGGFQSLPCPKLQPLRRSLLRRGRTRLRLRLVPESSLI